MQDEGQDKLPDHLVPLVEPTPSGAAKLLAAWDGLGTESQILIMTHIYRASAPRYQTQKVYEKALESENSYIRYLAAKRLYLDLDEGEETKALKERIEQDPDPLVRYCLLEYNEGITPIFDEDLEDAEAFFDLPHEARLAKVRTLNGHGERIAALIEDALDQLQDGTVTELEIFEILCDYLAGPGFKCENDSQYNPDIESLDGWGEYSKGKDMEALWNLVLKLPKRISYLLILKLPPAVGFMSEIPENVIQGMTDNQLASLLKRRDIKLEELRKRVFLENVGKGDTSWGPRNAALLHNFDLSYEEVAEILAKPKEEKKDCLVDLANANDLSLCLFDAVHDSLCVADSWELGHAAADSLKRKLAKLQGWQRKEELRELRLYRLARRAVPWKEGDRVYPSWAEGKTYPPSGELGFLAEHIVPEDTWATFMAFSKEWRQNGRRKHLESLLPAIGELDEEDLFDVEMDEADTLELKQPLSKGDFFRFWFRFWLERKADFHSTVAVVLYAAAFLLAAYGVYALFGDGLLSGDTGPALGRLIARLIVAAILYWLGRQVERESRKIRGEMGHIRGQTHG